MNARRPLLVRAAVRTSPVTQLLSRHYNIKVGQSIAAPDYIFSNVGTSFALVDMTGSLPEETLTREEKRLHDMARTFKRSFGIVMLASENFPAFVRLQKAIGGMQPTVVMCNTPTEAAAIIRSLAESCSVDMAKAAKDAFERMPVSALSPGSVMQQLLGLERSDISILASGFGGLGDIAQAPDEELAVLLDRQRAAALRDFFQRDAPVDE